MLSVHCNSLTIEDIQMPRGRALLSVKNYKREQKLYHWLTADTLSAVNDSTAAIS